VARDYLTGTTPERDTSILLQLELRGLGPVGDNIDAFLDRAVYGYGYGTDRPALGYGTERAAFGSVSTIP
jgi:hypothetical protein